MAYQTLLKNAEMEIIEKKSRFLGFAAPVQSAEDALEMLDKIKKSHRDASHNCYAYIVGQNKGIIRYSDDGEPSGTAGKPIVEVMLKKDVVDCTVIVTRYFGGILLGTGGLVRAYTHAASIALDAAGICTMHDTCRMHLQIEYPQWDKVDHMLKTLPVINENTEYMQHVLLSVLCRVSDEETVINELTQITDGKLIIRKEEATLYHPWSK